ncbi:MAG: NAD(P)-dependent glycerol-3-phosphate dehydrogenase [Acidobacteria bacterium]|nr:NAD(P)-dependent glycerol-3-phosphate dehydrogenase [Acidobacteriota bacterium]
MKNVAIIGAGGWGTALAIALARKAGTIRLWVFEPDLCESLRKTRVNDLYLPGFRIPENVEPTGDLSVALAGAEMILSVPPSHHLRGIYQQMLPWLEPHQIFVSATKGLENNSLLRMSQVIEESLQAKFQPKLAVISGPTFSKEVAQGQPAALVVASSDESLALLVQREFSHSAFRLYTNNDVVGVELGGAVKNVIAIAAGVCDGLGMGANAIAALITRGLSEITRLACACGGRRETMAGLAGLGDLVLTCTGGLSRNRTVGVKLGEGQSLTEILKPMRMVAEGINTTAATLQLARQKGVEMPITEQMHALLYHNCSPQDAVRNLMERSLKAE